VDRVAEGDDPAYDHRAPLMQRVDRLWQVIDRLDRPDFPPERDRRVKSDRAGLVLQIELHRVDPTRVDEIENPTPQLGVRPRIERDVHGTNRRARPPRDELDADWP
jgi:hypothetical protein